MKFFLSTKNMHKLTEFKRILNPLGIHIICERDLPYELPDVEEDGKTFEENALIKAREGFKRTGLPSVADDSGLCVDALNGEPGIYSARYAGEPSNMEVNKKLLLKNLSGVPFEKRTARFISAVACVLPDGREFTVTGRCEGHIGFEEKGNSGFGYDPLFISEIGCFGELTDEQKDSVSHRGNSLMLFKEELKKYL